VEISPTIPLDSFVRTGVLSKDYNATWRHQRMNHGRLACQLSLVHTLQLFLNSSNKYALIFEGRDM
jgi:GR25 family glycosyltransferase involved in LPS biosynthesis